MTFIRTALVRLNLVSQKIGFWEVQLANAIKRAEFLDNFDAKQVSKEKQVTKSELSNFERAVRTGTCASMLQKRFANLSQPTIAIINSKLPLTLNDRVNFEDLEVLEKLCNRRNQRLYTSTQTWLSTMRDWFMICELF